MTEDTDLLPWVLGGMLTLGAVAAIAVGLPDPTPGGAAPAPRTSVSASNAQAAPSAAAALPAAPADLSPVVASTPARPQLPTGQVWECDVNGQRVFSDLQCGTHATVRQLTELNVFDSSAASGHAAPRPYGYGAGHGYYPQPMPASEAPPDDSDAGGGDPIYTQVIVVHDRARRDQQAHHGTRPRPRAAHP